jgi:predicted Rdx family selenoprotein
VVELEGTFGNKLHCTLHGGDRRGVRGVQVDGELVYSKLATGRFPKKGEVAALVKARLGKK